MSLYVPYEGKILTLPFMPILVAQLVEHQKQKIAGSSADQGCNFSFIPGLQGALRFVDFLQMLNFNNYNSFFYHKKSSTCKEIQSLN